MTKKHSHDENSTTQLHDCYQVAFQKGNSCITPHFYEYNGGVWKVFKGRNCMGTFDKLLKTKIGN